MNITLQVLGEHFKQLRKKLDIKQEDIANKIGAQQNAISRIENGVGGSIDVLLSLMNFYSEFFYIDNIFSRDFEVVELSEMANRNRKFESIAAERLKLVMADLDEIVNLLDPEH